MKKLSNYLPLSERIKADASQSTTPSPLPGTAKKEFRALQAEEATIAEQQEEPDPAAKKNIP